MPISLVTADYVTTAPPGGSYNDSSITMLPNGYALLLDQQHLLGEGEVTRVRVANFNGSWTFGADTTFASGGRAVCRTPTVTSTGDVVIMTGKDGRGYRLISVDQGSATASVGSLVSAGSGTTVIGQRGARLTDTDDMIFLRTTEAGIYAEAVNVDGGVLTVVDTLALDTGAGAGDGYGTVVAIDDSTAFAALALAAGGLRVYRILLGSGTLSATSTDVDVDYTARAELYSALSGYPAEIILPDPDAGGQYIRRGIKYASGSFVVDTLPLSGIDYSQLPPDVGTGGAFATRDDLPAAYTATGSHLIVARAIDIGGVSDPEGGRSVVLDYDMPAGTIASYHWDVSTRGTGVGDARDLIGYIDATLQAGFISGSDAHTLDYIPGTQGPYTATEVAATIMPAGTPTETGMTVTITATEDAVYGVMGSGAVFDIAQSAADPVLPSQWQMNGSISTYMVYGAGSADLETVSSFQTVPRHSYAVGPSGANNMHHVEWWYADLAGNPAQYLGTYVPIGFPSSELVRPAFTHLLGDTFTEAGIDLTLTNLRISGGYLVVDYTSATGIPSNRSITFYCSHWYEWVQNAYTISYPDGNLGAGLTGVFATLTGPIPAGSDTVPMSAGGGLFNHGDTDVRNYYVTLAVREIPSGDFLAFPVGVGTPFFPAYRAWSGDVRVQEYAVTEDLVFDLADGGYVQRTRFV